MISAHAIETAAKAMYERDEGKPWENAWYEDQDTYRVIAGEYLTP